VSSILTSSTTFAVATVCAYLLDRLVSVLERRLPVWRHR
jgi:predicted PurR-regulated permease PerM